MIRGSHYKKLHEEIASLKAELAKANEAKAELLAALAKLRELIGDGFHREGGTDLTGWDSCGHCGQDDFRGHKSDCQMLIGMNAADAAISKHSK